MRLWSKHTILPPLALAGKYGTTDPLTWQFGSATRLCARLGARRGGARRSLEGRSRSQEVLGWAKRYAGARLRRSRKLRRSRLVVPYQGDGDESGKTFEICDISE